MIRSEIILERRTASIAIWREAMARQKSRAYKLQLSADGVQLFLRCHGRLCRAVGDFLPYGTTLFMAVELAGRNADDEIAARFLDAELHRYGGRIVRYVGTSMDLSILVAGLVQRLSKVETIHPSPQTWKLFLMALVAMEEVDDSTMLNSFDRVAVQLGRTIERTRE